MAVHGSGHSMMVHASGPSMSVAHGGVAGLVGPLQDKLNRLLLNANSPAKSSGHGSLIAAGRYDNLSASLSQSVKVSFDMLVFTPIAASARGSCVLVCPFWSLVMLPFMPTVLKCRHMLFTMLVSSKVLSV